MLSHVERYISTSTSVGDESQRPYPIAVFFVVSFTQEVYHSAFVRPAESSHELTRVLFSHSH